MSELQIYHERQTAALCGQHCLNNLLQGCIWTPSSLSDIALDLDRMEKDLGLSMGTGVDVNSLRFELQGTIFLVEMSMNQAISQYKFFEPPYSGLTALSWSLGAAKTTSLPIRCRKLALWSTEVIIGSP